MKSKIFLFLIGLIIGATIAISIPVPQPDPVIISHPDTSLIRAIDSMKLRQKIHTAIRNREGLTCRRMMVDSLYYIGYGHQYLPGEKWLYITPAMADSIMESDFTKCIVIAQRLHPNLPMNRQFVIAHRKYCGAYQGTEVYRLVKAGKCPVKFLRESEKIWWNNK